MEDYRVSWMKERVFSALGLREDKLFLELLSRDEQKASRELVSCLDQKLEGYSPAMLFYPLEHEVEEMVEVIEEQEIQNLVEQAEQLVEVEQEAGDEGGEPAATSASGSASADEAGSESGSSEENKQEGEEGSTSSEKSIPRKVLKKSMVKKLVRKKELFLCYKHLPEDVTTVAFYFIRTQLEPIPVPSSHEEASSLLPKCFETGTINHKPLNALERMLKHIYIPMLMIQGQRGEASESSLLSRQGSREGEAAAPQPAAASIKDTQDASMRRSESKMKAMLRDEVLINAQKFKIQIQRTIQQVEGEVKLEVPDIELGEDPVAVARNRSIVNQLEAVMEKWGTIISKTVDEQLKKVPQGNGPLAEVDFWKERSSALSAVYEQVKLPAVQHILAVLKEANVASFSNFEYHRSELNKYYLEARDNVKFLGTLERHLKNLAHGANFTIVLETLPALMNSLRMVWVISRHYNTDERMVPMMERIAWEICERVARVVNVKTVFRLSLPEIKATAVEARQTMDTWKQAYLDVRKKIEQSGRDARWEFDRKKLFERSEYIAQVCSDIYDIAQTIEEFHNIFGPELKAVTGDSEKIEEVVNKVDCLVLDIETVRFDPYNPLNRVEWKTVMDRFQREVKLIEEEANNFIDESFKSLRSAEGTFDMLHKFKNIHTRDAINTTMMKKFNEILKAFEKEVDEINELFEENRGSPPISKSQPPVAGAITWSRSLFQRIKHTVLRFQTKKELIDSDAGKAASRRYLAVARSMKQYEDELYSQWLERVEATLPNLLKRTVLSKPPSTPTVQSSVHTPVSGDSSRTASRAATVMDFSHIIPPALPPNCEFVVNFAPELSEAIAETKYLEKLGFGVPDLARSVALQEEKFIAFQDGLNHILHRYHHVLASLSEPETELLDDHIKTLQRVLRPGSKRLNWNSLGIQDYIAKCEQAITKFESLANQIQKNAGDINERLHMIESVRLFKRPPPRPGCELPEAKEYFEFQESYRNGIFNSLSRKYHAIGPLLIKMEGLVVYSNTGKSPRLMHYYSYWERRVFDALVKMVTSNLQYYGTLLQSGKLLFTVEALLSAPEIVLHPHANELFKLMMQATREIVEGCKKFIRWKKGSCIVTEPVSVAGQDEPVMFSFFADVSSHPSVLELATAVQETIRNGIGALVKHANWWKKYRALWKMQRDILLEKFAQKQPSCVAYDEKMQVYKTVDSEVASLPSTKEVEFALLRMEPLARALQENARCWVTSLGKLLNDAAKESLVQLKNELSGLSKDLTRPPDTLEDLKFVLSVIARIRAMSLDVEILYRDIQERYRTLTVYNITVAEEELEMVGGLEQQWRDLFNQGREVDKSLIKVKKKFTLITNDQVSSFSEEAENFKERFKTEGPASVGTDLDKGLVITWLYKC